MAIATNPFRAKIAIRCRFHNLVCKAVMMGKDNVGTDKKPTKMPKMNGQSYFSVFLSMRYENEGFYYVQRF